MPFDQFNVRLGNSLARRVRLRAAETGVRPRDVLAEALVRHFGWPLEEPEPVDGQLTVDEAQEQDAATHLASGDSERAPASRRPRAAEQAKRANGTPPVDSPGDPVTSPATGGDPAGCPECGADVEHGKCVDCGWLA